MKRILYAGLFAAAATLSLGSCMNGDYDANPAVNAGSTPNPSYDPGGGSGSGGGGGNTTVTPAARGEIKVAIDGKVYTFGFANWMDFGTGRLISGTLMTNNNMTSNGILLYTDSYTGTATYTIGVNTSYAQYNITTLMNPTQGDEWDTRNTIAAGTGEIKVTEDANNEMKGEFHFTAFRTKPTESASEKVSAINGNFYVPKL